ncbi:MAG: calcium-binding protein [Pseudomonadota bacterium]
MAFEFITSLQTTTYSVDSFDQIFLTPTGEFQLDGDAFGLSSNTALSAEVYLNGDIYADGVAFFVTENDADFTFVINASASIFTTADTFLFVGSADNFSQLSITNNGSITSSEVVFFARNYDVITIHNSGTVSAVSDETEEAIFDTLSPRDATWQISNSGLIQSTLSQKIMDLGGSITFDNTGTIIARVGDAIELIEGSMRLTNSGTIIADIMSGGDTEVINQGAFTGDFDSSGNNNFINSGTFIGWIEFENFDDTITNSGTIIGRVDLGGGDNVVSNSGLIDTGEQVIQGGGNADTILNTGEILGDIDLSGGFDEYRGAGDGFVAGVVFGGTGNDTIFGANGADEFDGGEDSDLLNGRGGNDTLFAGSGSDTLLGGAGEDALFGQSGANVLNGQGGNDTINGGSGDDRLLGGNGDDTLKAGEGADILRGDAGADVFEFSSVAETGTGSTRDRILGWEDGADLIDLSGFGALTFSAMGPIGSGTASVWFQSVSGGAQTMLRIDTDGDGIFDGQVLLVRADPALFDQADLILG